MKIKVYVDSEYEVCTEKEALDYVNETIRVDKEDIFNENLSEWVENGDYEIYDMIFSESTRLEIKTKLDEILENEIKNRMEEYFIVSEIEV